MSSNYAEHFMKICLQVALALPGVQFYEITPLAANPLHNEFKISVVAYKTLQCGKPKYFKESLHLYKTYTCRSNPGKKFLQPWILTIDYIPPSNHCLCWDIESNGLADSLSSGPVAF